MLKMSEEITADDVLLLIHKLDRYVLGPTSLIGFQKDKCPISVAISVGFFANTQNELYQKMTAGESEELYEILDGGELYRYVSARNHKCYALYMPVKLFQLLQGELPNG